MRRGCIAVGLIKCDICDNNIEHGERYLILEDGTDTKKRICLNCCADKKYGKYGVEKGEKIFTLLADEPEPKVDELKSERKTTKKSSPKRKTSKKFSKKK